MAKYVCASPWYVSVLAVLHYDNDRRVLSVNIASFLVWNRAPNALRPTSKSVHTAIALLTFTTVVFRSEILLLLGPLVLQALISGYTSLSNIIKVGILAGLSSIGLFYRPLLSSYFLEHLLSQL